MEHKLFALFSLLKKKKMFKKSCVNNDNDCSMMRYNVFVDSKHIMTIFHYILEHYILEKDLIVAINISASNNHNDILNYFLFLRRIKKQ